jgi:hypothetical protein
MNELEGQLMTIRELVKSEIDTLPDDMLYAVRDFVLSQKERRTNHPAQTRDKNIQWLEESWEISDFKPLSREELYDRI